MRSTAIAGSAILVAVAVLAGACGGQNGPANEEKSGPLPVGPSCPSGNFPSTNSCGACANAQCVSAEACLPTQCGDFVACLCACPADNLACVAGCYFGAVSLQCGVCLGGLQQCEQQSCPAECGTGTPLTDDAGTLPPEDAGTPPPEDAGLLLDLHLDAGDAPLSACSDLRACCASIPDPNIRQGCNSNVPSTPTGCESMLQLNKSLGMCR